MKPSLGPLLKSREGMVVASPSVVSQKQLGGRLSLSVPATAQFLAGSANQVAITFRYQLGADEIAAGDGYSADLFDIISDDLGGYFGIVPFLDSGSATLYTVLYGPPGIFAFTDPSELSSSTWVTVTLLLSRRSNGQVAAQLSTSDSNPTSCLSNALPTFTFNKIYAGSFISRLPVNQRLLDDFSVRQESDPFQTWTADFFSGTLDYFDSTVGTGISVVPQDFDYALSIDNAGTDAYGVRSGGIINYKV